MRRVITGLDAEGKSIVLVDSSANTVWHLTSPEVVVQDGVSVVNTPISVVPELATKPAAGDQFIELLWRTSEGVPGLPVEDEAAAQKDFEMEPPGDGFFWRYHSWGPDCDVSALHTTDTLDILLVLEGEVELVLDRESVLLTAGDTVMLPAVSHGWRTEPGCKMLQVMQRIERS